MAIKKIKAMFTKTEVPVTTVPAKKVAAKKVAAKKVVAPKKAVVKKATKKVAAKKTVAKKVVTAKKTASPKRLVVASDSESFWVNDGQVLNSLVALEAAFKTMKPAVFSYHRTEGSNHFAEWVEAVLMDVECAKALRGAKNAAAAHIIVARHLKTYAK